ncbi:MAG TPA: hypothetical protein VHH73_13275 [Verrucomicrobiae bacterium]|nr:hypothetical protein [Verrucomicrobiae bacterium]
MLAQRVKQTRLALSRHPVARAMLISLLFHALLFPALELGRQVGLWRMSPLHDLAEAAMEVTRRAQEKKAQALKPPENREPPLLFVEVDPAEAVTDPAPDAKYYSSHSTRAKNPDPTIDSNTPKITGQQTKVIKTEDVARNQPRPVPPTPQPLTPPPKEEPKPEEKPQPVTEPKPETEIAEARPKPAPAQAPGDLAFNKPSPQPRTDPGTAASSQPEAAPRKHERPRTIAEAKRLRGDIPGEKMKQEGGVKTPGLATTLDVRSTTFGAYDAAIIAAIQQHWYDLLDQKKFAFERSGRVVLEFHLNNDGRITNMKVDDNDVGDFWAIICQKAVEDPAPYAPWTAEMKREIGRSYREVRFTFFYN